MFAKTDLARGILDLSSKNAQCNFQVVGSIIFSKAVMALTVEKWAHMEKGICFISPDQPSERVVWLRCINSSWNVVFTCRLVFFVLCRHIVRIRINHILVSASSFMLFDPLKAERKLLLACEIWFFTCIGVIFWQVSKTQSNLTSSLALPLFSTPSMNHLFIWAKNEVLCILMSGALF